MSGFPDSPKLLKGGIVLVDPETASVQQIITLQYNPETLSRSLQVKSMGDSGDRSEAFRLTGPPVETFKLDAEMDATDQLEMPDQHPNTVAHGLHPQLASLELLVHPSSSQLQASFVAAQSGSLEIAPMETSMALFVWSSKRVLPVRVTDFSVTEEDYDPALNPIRAKVSIGLRVLTMDDLGFEHKGGSLFMVHLQEKERLSGLAPNGSLSAFGIGSIV